MRILFLVGNQTEYLSLRPLYTAFLHSIKLSEHRIEKKIDKDPLAVEQNNYLTKIVYVYILYDLDAWPKNLINNFKFKNSYLEQLIYRVIQKSMYKLDTE